MRRVLDLLLLSGMAISIAACAGAGKKTDEAEGVAATGESETAMVDESDKLLETRVLYFDFDSSVIKSEYQEILAAHAEYISGHPDITVILEGHADERGTREYNIALGERRAKAVHQLLTLQGVSQKQLQVISFGEERPVALGHDESAWSLNRRVELLYSGE